jgi:hypothetical protein
MKMENNLSDIYGFWSGNLPEIGFLQSKVEIFKIFF